MPDTRPEGPSVQDCTKLWTDLLNAMNALEEAEEDPAPSSDARIAGGIGTVEWDHATETWQLRIMGD